MILEPMKRWICDSCRQMIERPEHGWLEWVVDNDSGKNSGFRIVHHIAHSPRGPDGTCYRYGRQYEESHPKVMTMDVPLHDVLGNDGEMSLPYLLSMVDPGPYRNDPYTGPRVDDFRGWVEIVRRLTIPNYEEARANMGRAAQDGLFDGESEPGIYSPEMLRQVIERYGVGAPEKR